MTERLLFTKQKKKFYRHSGNHKNALKTQQNKKKTLFTNHYSQNSLHHPQHPCWPHSKDVEEKRKLYVFKVNYTCHNKTLNSFNSMKKLHTQKAKIK